MLAILAVLPSCVVNLGAPIKHYCYGSNLVSSIDGDVFEVFDCELDYATCEVDRCVYHNETPFVIEKLETCEQDFCKFNTDTFTCEKVPKDDWKELINDASASLPCYTACLVMEPCDQYSKCNAITKCYAEPSEITDNPKDNRD